MDRVSQKRRSKTGLIAAVVIAVALVDQAVKQVMLSILNEGEPLPVIGDWFRFTLLFNPGAAFSMGGEGSTWLFTTIQLVFVLGVAVAAPRITHSGQAVGLALIAGGALGNFADRIFRAPGFWFGHVVDYISVGSFAVFNIADAAITCGVVLFIITMVLEERKAEHE
ncbi:signal peptidase II [Corynebacterium kefirresidentii]|uniref:Lipoprotein signal peptidase n=1 Tax=Corynebacterium kefirresidentii TaxID=1979527 RepID=A0ABT8Q1E4_9CORY|nr:MULTISPECIES: signal peptidase II [Corynebacterium]WKS54696.1 signal peptidase II [Corynebacterium tuberculostearicum]MCG7449192.1 signal peptidase II [Corynebacterium kefirresidentii]MCG7451284.1 signal peptidase II [Corynebacterium kefirresidentii]MCK6083575.1 signal peptidase II [Corynebacterium kefirresidentii]MCK6096719.1 signal peptidase II [Corynebacterium kefirresidentii]